MIHDERDLSRTLTEPNLRIGEARRGEPMPDSLAGVDPVLHRLQEAPYDPVATSQGGGLLVGLAASSTEFTGWMRPLGYLLALALLSNLGSLAYTIVAGLRDSRTGVEQALIDAAPGSLFALAMGIAGALVLWRLVTTRPVSTGTNLSR